MHIYEMSILVRNEWQAHSMSNIGSGGTNRMLPRRQRLATGTETDACSGDILKHHNAALVAEFLEAESIPLCPACSVRDARRAGALADTRTTDIEMKALLQCPLCDIHGFLLPAKKAAPPLPGLPSRAKDSLIEFSYALAEPDSFGETVQLNVRKGGSDGDDQMIMRTSCRSGAYALCIRYNCVGIGVDTNLWQLQIGDEAIRHQRHRCVLRALRDQILSPDGAKTTGMLPHLTGINGSIVIRTEVGRAYMCSPLRPDFVEQIDGSVSKSSDAGVCLHFHNLEEFAVHMEFLIETSTPSTPRKHVLPILGN